MSDPLIFTLKQLHEDTAGVIQAIHETGQSAVITRMGRFLAVIRPITAEDEAKAISDCYKAQLAAEGPEEKP
jgi:antitoxin (DNA-binding transcriptional repressor) of toxin-antitoxin stability system